MKHSMIGVMVAVPFRIETKVFTDCDDQMRAVSVVTGATETEFKSITDKAKLLGRTTSYIAAQVAGVMLELGRAGLISTVIDAVIAGNYRLQNKAQKSCLFMSGATVPSEPYDNEVITR